MSTRWCFCQFYSNFFTDVTIFFDTIYTPQTLYTCGVWTHEQIHVLSIMHGYILASCYSIAKFHKESPSHRPYWALNRISPQLPNLVVIISNNKRNTSQIQKPFWLSTSVRPVKFNETILRSYTGMRISRVLSVILDHKSRGLHDRANKSGFFLCRRVY